MCEIHSLTLREELGESCTLFERGEIYAGIWWGILKERDHFIDPKFYGSVI